MKKTFIIANWKMNPETLAEARNNFEIIRDGVKNIKNVETVVCPPFVYLSSLKATKSVKLGAQNCYVGEKGPFTGEVSPRQIKNLGCQYVILGHSERRKYFKEDAVLVNQKIRAAIEAGLRVIFCVGSGRKKPSKEIDHQMEAGLQGVDRAALNNLIFVYEPVWAISTTKNKITATPREALFGSLYMRKVIEKLFGAKAAKKSAIIYGGSVDSENINGFIKEGLMEGGLVGAASLRPKEFIKIVKNIR